MKQSEKRKSITLALLAAGQSSRFDGIKLAQSITDIDHQGKQVNQALLLHSLDKLNTLSAYLTTLKISNEVIVVLGSHEDTLKKLLPPTTKTVLNLDSKIGLSTSVKIAVETAKANEATDLLLALGDHIGVRIEDYKNLVDLWVEKQQNVCAFYEGSLAVPALFNENQFSALSTLKGDQGAKPILTTLFNNKQLAYFTLPNGVYDIDTRDDITRWQQQQIS